MKNKLKSDIVGNRPEQGWNKWNQTHDLHVVRKLAHFCPTPHPFLLTPLSIFDISFHGFNHFRCPLHPRWPQCGITITSRPTCPLEGLMATRDWPSPGAAQQLDYEPVGTYYDKQAFIFSQRETIRGMQQQQSNHGGSE